MPYRFSKEDASNKIVNLFIEEVRLVFLNYKVIVLVYLETITIK